MAVTLGENLTWEDALPLVRALRDIAQSSGDEEAVDVASLALHETFGEFHTMLILENAAPSISE